MLAKNPSPRFSDPKPPSVGRRGPALLDSVIRSSDGKGGKEAKRWAPEWGGMWGPKS